jgi:hypothetical protein
VNKPITLKDIERMARNLVKDPATKRTLERQFREVMDSDSSDSPNKKELDKLYKEVQKKFKHGFSVDDLGDKDDKQS